MRRGEDEGQPARCRFVELENPGRGRLGQEFTIHITTLVHGGEVVSTRAQCACALTSIDGDPTSRSFSMLLGWAGRHRLCAGRACREVSRFATMSLVGTATTTLGL